MRPRLIVAVAVYQPLDLVEDLLGAADAEGRDQHRAVIPQRPLHHLFQLQAALAPPLVQAVAIGALDHQGIGFVGRTRCRQQRRVGRAQVAGEHHPVLFARGFHLAFHVGRAEDMPRRLEADGDAAASGGHRLLPAPVGQGHDAPGNQVDEALQLAPVAGDAHLHGVFQHQRQQPRRGFGADDRPPETSGQQVGYAPHVVDMHVAHHQRLDVLDGKVDLQGSGIRSAARRLRPLEQPAVHQHARAISQAQLVAGAGDAVDGAVVTDLEE